jgi:hypothetical protein
MSFSLNIPVSSWRSAAPSILSEDEDSLGPPSIPYSVNMVNEGAASRRTNSAERRQQAKENPTLADIMNALTE